LESDSFIVRLRAVETFQYNVEFPKPQEKKQLAVAEGSSSQQVKQPIIIGQKPIITTKVERGISIDKDRIVEKLKKILLQDSLEIKLASASALGNLGDKSGYNLAVENLAKGRHKILCINAL
jgi:hypothetical protein